MKKYFYLLTVVYFLLSLLKKLGRKDDKSVSSDVAEPASKRTDHIWKDYDLTIKEEFRDAFLAEKMQTEWQHFEKLLRPEIRIKPRKVEDADLKLGKSKIGGCPDLPAHIEWPMCEGKNLLFLAQVNFEEIAHLQAAAELPKRGLLYFFYKNELAISGDKLEDKKGFKVIFVEDTTNLSRKQSHSAGEKKTIPLFRPCKLTYREAWNLPSSSWPGVRKHLSGDDFSRLMDFRSPPEMNTRTKLLGYADEIQGEMEGLCEWLLGVRSKKWADNYAAGVKNWRLLFQLDSENEALMMFGDTGRLYFWIKDSDLKAGNLEEVWMMLQYH